MRNRVVTRRRAAGAVSRGDAARGRVPAAITRECACEDKDKHPPDSEEDRGAFADCMLYDNCGGD